MQVLRCLRVDRVTVAVTHFVAAALGPDFVQPPVLEYADVLRQSSERTPILFVLSPGADPAFDIFRLGAHSWLFAPYSTHRIDFSVLFDVRQQWVL